MTRLLSLLEKALVAARIYDARGSWRPVEEEPRLYMESEKWAGLLTYKTDCISSAQLGWAQSRGRPCLLIILVKTE